MTHEECGQVERHKNPIRMQIFHVSSFTDFFQKRHNKADKLTDLVHMKMAV